MGKEERTVVSGCVGRLSDDTGSERLDASGWSQKPVTITVPSSRHGNRIHNINERLRGSIAKSTTSAK